MGSKFYTSDIDVAAITIPRDRRSVDPEKAASLAESIREHGLLQPIGVDDDYRLIFGRHRIEAHKLLGWKTITARIMDITGLNAELAEIDENLIRSELTALERMQSLARRKEIYEELHPDTKAGKSQATGMNRSIGNNVSAQCAPTFTEDTAVQTGLSKRKIETDVAVATSIDPKAAKAIASTPIADNKSELKKLGKLEPQEQREAAKKIKSGEAKTVAEAAAPKPEKSETVEDRMKAANAVLESSARSIKTIRDELEKIDNPHLSDAMHGRLATILAHLKSAEGTIRSAKGAGECTYCGGKGCKHCLKTGWLTKTALESAPENKAA